MWAFKLECISFIRDVAPLVCLCTLLRELVIKQHGILHRKWIDGLIQRVFTTKTAMNAYFPGGIIHLWWELGAMN